MRTFDWEEPTFGRLIYYIRHPPWDTDCFVMLQRWSFMARFIEQPSFSKGAKKKKKTASIVTVFSVFNLSSRRSETFCQSEKLDVLWSGSWCLISHTNGSFSFNIRWRKPLALQPVEMPHSFCWLMTWLRTLCQAAHWEAWQPPQGFFFFFLQSDFKSWRRFSNGQQNMLIIW